MKYFFIFLILVASDSFAGNIAGPAVAGVATAAATAMAASASAAAVAAGSTNAGVKLMNKFCGNTFGGEAMCAIGAGLVVTAITDAMESDKNHNIANGLTPGSPGATTPAYDAIQPQVAAAQQIAAAQGTTLPALAAQAPTSAAGLGGGSGSGQVGAGGEGLVPGTATDGQGAGDAAAAGRSGFRVSSVGTDGGGGGGGRAPASSGSADDISSLLAGLKGKSASGGLQKSLNGDPIGVASDNIFTKITQAYQAKTTAQTFLPTSN